MKKMDDLPGLESLESNCMYIIETDGVADVYVTKESGYPLAVRGSVFPDGYFENGSIEDFIDEFLPEFDI